MKSLIKYLSALHKGGSSVNTKTRTTSGFTLIELLIVIGILGILAVGLLAALDPIEQLKKGRDSNRKRIATEYQQAVIRYNATFGTMPTGLPTGATSLGSLGSLTTVLTTAGELKSSFTTSSTAYSSGTYGIMISSTAAGDVIACFDPESKAESENRTQLYSANTGTGACGATGNCFFCIR